MNVPLVNVGPARFGIMSLGAGLGLVAYAHYVTNIIPDSWEEWAVGPLKGTHIWMGAFALLGGALLSMAFSKVSH
jgi:hypothetical protein